METQFFYQIGAGLIVLAISGLVTYMLNSIRAGMEDLRKGKEKTHELLGATNVHLATLNGRMAKSEQWQTMHEEKDDERFKNFQEEHRALWQTIRGT